MRRKKTWSKRSYWTAERRARCRRAAVVSSLQTAFVRRTRDSSERRLRRRTIGTAGRHSGRRQDVYGTTHVHGRTHLHVRTTAAAAAAADMHCQQSSVLHRHQSQYVLSKYNKTAFVYITTPRKTLLFDMRNQGGSPLDHSKIWLGGLQRN